MECKTTSTKRRSAGFTLAEMMIAIGLGMLLVTTMTIVNIYYLKTFAGLENYMNLNDESRHALDIMTKDIRQADLLTAFSKTSLTLQLDGTNIITYSYDSTKKELTRSSGGKDKVLLRGITRNGITYGCDYWRNDFYDRNMGTNVTPANCKVVQVTWLCSRTILGHKVNTEDVQSAKIVIRKQKSS